jgi:hypothetical protein
MNDYNEQANEEPVEIYDWQEAVCEQVLDEWEKGQTYCTDLNNLYEDIYSMIRGERPKKNYDWESNIVINKVFQTIWTAIPYLTQKIFGASPIIGVGSFDKKGAWQREQILEFWHTLQSPVDKQHTTFFLIMVMWLLRSLLNGVGILKKGWHQKLQKMTQEVSYEVPLSVSEDGSSQTQPYTKKVTQAIPIEDWPHNVVCNNRDVVVDWLLKPGQSIRQGRFIIHRSVEDIDSLKRSKIKYMNLDKFTEFGGAHEIDDDHSPMTSKDGQDEKPKSDIYKEVELYERVGLYPVWKQKLDGKWVAALDLQPEDEDEVVFKEMVVTVGKCGKETQLVRFDLNEYEVKNYIDIHIYFDEERWQSEGMIEPVMDMQTALNDNINAMFDKIWQELMPPVIVNKFALWDWDTMQYAPRQRWLVGGNPQESIYFKPPDAVQRDPWQSHVMFNTEIELTSAVTPPMQGGAKEKAATTNVLNAQYSAGKLDFIVKMIEQTGLIPSAQMDVMFAKKFAHPLTFQAILGEPFKFSDWEEIYKYKPAASSVKLEYQKEIETTQDIQLIQIFSSVNNPNTPKILNSLWANILRNRNMPKEAAMFDEEYFEPQGEGGQLQMLKQMMGGPSNQNNVEMSGEEKQVRQKTYNPQGLMQ